MSARPGAIVPLDATVSAAALSCPVSGRTALARVLDSLLGPGGVPADRVVVVAAPTLLDEARRAVSDAGLPAVTVVDCAQPANRTQCLTRGLEWLAAEPHCAVIIHDHRSPLASQAVTARVLEELAAGSDLVVPGLPVTDTVKEADSSGAVVATIDRESLRTVQYPRGYRAAILASLLDGPDEFAAALTASLPVAMVAGAADALTAHLPDDAALLEAILAARPC